MLATRSFYISCVRPWENVVYDEVIQYSAAAAAAAVVLLYECSEHDLVSITVID